MKSDEYVEQFDSAHLFIQRAVSAMKVSLTELNEMKPPENLDYSREGIAHLFDEVARSQRQASRAAEILSNSIVAKSRAAQMWAVVQAIYQRLYDEAVVSKIKLLGNMSWEERASHFRLAVIDCGVRLRKIEMSWIELEALALAIDGRARQTGYASRDLAILVQTAQLGATIGELS